MEELGLNSLLSAGQSLLKYGVDIGNAMLGSGFAHKVFGAFAALASAVKGVKILLEVIEGESAGESLAELIELILVIGIFLFLLQNYGWIFADSLRSLFDAMGAAMGFGAGLGDPTAGLKALYGSIKSAHNLMFNPEDAWYTLIAKFVANGLAGVVLYVALLTILAAMVVYIAIYLMGDALAGVALAVGPFFIALGVWEVTRGWFRNWLEFLVLSFSYKVVASTLTLLLARAFQGQVDELVAAIGYTGAGEGGMAMLSIGLAAKAAILASVICLLLLAAPSIAHGIARGGISFSESAVKQMIPGLNKAGRGAGARGAGK